MPAGVAATPNVSFGYDAAGNRTSMNDGVGSATYVYNTLSQMTSETRTFEGLGPFTLSYPSYNLGGQLTNITNHWGAQVGCNYDKTGRPTGVTGAGYAGVTSYVNSISYRPFAVKQMSYGNGRTLSLQYDNRLRMTRWDVPGVMGWNYSYHYFGENSGRVTYAQNLYDGTLDRSYDYDHVGRMTVAYSGEDARAGVGIPGAQWGIQDGPYASPNWYDVWGNITARYGWGGEHSWFEASYTNNKLNGFTYDAAGNLLNDVGQNFSYDATGQQAQASYGGYLLQQNYDGDRLRVKKVENGVTTYYLRSSMLGGQVVAEVNGSGVWQRGYVYLGGELLAVQQNNQVSWMHQDPIVKSKRATDGAGNVVSTVELDPWGGNTNRSSNPGFQPRTFTSYARDGNASDEAMHRRYNRWHSRFDQPDPYDGSYDMSDPQSFNRYSYVQNDPVNFVDPTGLDENPPIPPIIPPPVIVPIPPAPIPTGLPPGVAILPPGTYVPGGIGGSPGGGPGGGPGGDAPQNPGQQGGPCDQTIASIFGDDDAVAAASGFEPTGFPDSDAWRNGQDRSRAGGPQPNQWGHLNGYSGHIYGSSPGTSDTTLYVPGNFSSYTPPSGNDAVATFFYRQLGNQRNVTLAVFHVGNFGIQRNNTNDAGSVRIGTSGGLGGDTVGYRHSHLEVHRGRGLPATMRARNRTRQFFSRVFCP